MSECKKYICIHGHYYQPPRENAWLEEIEIQESAHPYHDWNERITRECYRPNGVSRILNENGKIANIVNNYVRMSFNFGPTLLSWLEVHEPAVYKSIIEADYQSVLQFEGHGSALAQAYNHIIMPLANRRDKETQVIWGIHDFKRRFGRSPEGMWLSETAVDTETLEVLAENKIKFTVLAPSQAKRFKKIGDETWHNGIDTKRAYLCNLPSGNKINLFFYDGELSQGVAFKGFLNDGKNFAHQLLHAFDGRSEAQLVHIATDGESYGHHHRNGDMALAFCADYLNKQSDVELVNYGLFLKRFPPEYEVEIHENSSWSCAHGVERWRSNCGCKTGGEDHWTQEWRAPLRNALDYLRGELATIFEETLKPYHPNPWHLRNVYESVFSQRSKSKIKAFIQDNIHDTLSSAEITKIIRMLEMQKMSLYMYTSCGWFFNELSGIETVQILQYAERAIQLAEDVKDVDLYTEFYNHLRLAKSNLKEHGTGEDIYKKQVKNKRLSLTQVGMHYAVSSLFEDDARVLTVLNYECIGQSLEKYKAGQQILAIGRTRVRSKVTLSQKSFTFVIIYLGNHHLIGNTSDYLEEAPYEALCDQLRKTFDAGNLSEALEIVKENFKQRSFSFFDLFKDEQLKLLNRVLDYQVNGALDFYERINDRTYSLLNVMQAEGLTLPDVLVRNLEVIVIQRLANLLKIEGLVNIEQLKEVEFLVKKWKIQLPLSQMNFYAGKKVDHLVHAFYKGEKLNVVVDNANETLKLMRSIGLKPDVNLLQDLVFQLIKEGKQPKSEIFGLLVLANNLGMEVVDQMRYA